MRDIQKQTAPSFEKRKMDTPAVSFFRKKGVRSIRILNTGVAMRCRTGRFGSAEFSTVNQTVQCGRRTHDSGNLSCVGVIVATQVDGLPTARHQL